MARWKLLVPHYLFGYPPDMTEEGIEWEYKETDRLTGREKRRRYKVPFYMDEGAIVCHEGRGLESDIVFEGNPTHDMVPLDKEAKEITAKLPNALSFDQQFPGTGEGGFSTHILSAIEAQIARLGQRLDVAAVPAAESGVSKADFEALQKTVYDLLGQNAKLQEQLNAVAAAGAGAEVVIDDLEPLPPEIPVTPPPPPTGGIARRSL